MPKFPFDYLLEPPTSTEVKESIYEIISTLGVNTTLWKAGAVVRALIAAFAILIASCFLLVSKLARMRFLTLSEGNWKKQVAYYDYGVDAREATAATTTCTFTNTGGGIWDEAAGDVQVTNPTTGKVYQTTEALALSPAGQAGDEVTIGVQAIEPGSGSHAGAGTITAIVSPAMFGVTVTNPYAAVAVDEETDEELDSECGAKLESLSPMGPGGAYEYAAKRKGLRQDGTLVPITSVQTYRTSLSNAITVVVAGPSGAVSGNIQNPATDLGSVHRGIQLWAVPQGITETTISSTPMPISLMYSLVVWSTSSQTDEGFRKNAEAGLLTFFSVQPVGGWNDGTTGTGKIFLDGIRRAIGNSDPHILSVTMEGPGADVDVPLGYKPTLGSVTQSTVIRS